MSAAAASPVHPLPLPALFTALIALLAFAISGGGIMLCAALGALIAASYQLDSRLTAGSLQVRVLRLIVMGALLLLRLSQPEKQLGFTRDFGANLDLYLVLAGQLAAVEMALQFWQWPPWAGERGAVIVLLSGLVFTAAAKPESDKLPMMYITPTYVLFLVLALYAVRSREPRQQTFGGAPAIVALLLVFGLGAGTSMAIWRWHNELTTWFTHILTPQVDNDFAVGIARNPPALGATSNLRLSARRVLRIEGELREHHFRGIAFDTYNGGVWGPTFENRKGKFVPGLLSGQEKPSGPVLNVTRLIDERLLVAPLHCSGVIHAQTIDWIAQEGGPLKGALLPATHTVLLSNEPDHQGPLCVPPAAEYMARCLEVSGSISPRVKDLAEQIAGGERDPRKRAEMVADYLRTHHTYSRTFDPGAGDQISNFLLEKRGAHCEYFASAAVMLLRCLKIPARYVCGYYAHDTNADGVTIVRQFDAHAWAECYIDGRGWITVDATPPEGLPNAESDRVPWYTSLWEQLEDKWDAFKDWLSELNATRQIASVLILVAFVLFLQWLRGYRGRLKLKPAAPFSYSSGADFALLAKAFEELLRAKGIPCPPQRTWQEHLAALPAATPPALNIHAAAEFERQYARLRFGAASDPAALAELNGQLKSLAGGNI